MPPAYAASLTRPTTHGSATVAVTGERLRIEVPGSHRHNPGSPNEAVRAMQAVDDTDLDLAVKFDALPATGYQMQGFVFEESPSRYLRFDVHHSTSTLRAYAASVHDGTATPRVDVAIPPTTGPIWLRVLRTASAWTFRYSFDGEVWTDAGTFAHDLAVTSSGVFAGNWHTSGPSTPAYTAEVVHVENTDAPLSGDPHPVTAEITAPREDDVVFSDALLATSVMGDGPVDRVEFYAGDTLAGTATEAPYEVVWDTTTSLDGELVITARVFAGGVQAADASVPVTVDNSLDGAGRVHTDYEQGVLDADDHALLGFWSLMGDERLPARYQAGEVDEHTTTGWGLVFASNWDDLEPATREELEDYFAVWEEPLEGPAGASSGFPDCGRSIWVGLARYGCRTDIGPFRIVYDLESDHSGRGVEEVDLLDAGLEAGANGVPDFVDRVAFGLTRSLEHFVDDLAYLPPTGTITVVVWSEGRSGFAPPPQLPGAGIYIANRHLAPQYLAAHELFHVIQYRYIGPAALLAPWRTWWWMEATAEWAAHQAEWYVGGWKDEAPGAYASALPRFLGRPTESLYRFNNPRGGDPRQYGAFVFAEYLDMVAGRDAIRGTWERLVADPHSAIVQELQSHGLDLVNELPRFAQANYFLDYSIPPRLKASDIDVWREDWLGADSRTLGDAFSAEPRPARQYQADLVSGERDFGSVRLDPGGTAYLEFRPPGPGEVHLTLETTRSDDVVRAVGVPRGCGVDTVVLPRGQTETEVNVAVPATCDLVTLIATHANAASSFTTRLDWDIAFTPTEGVINHGLVQLGVHPHGRLAIPDGSPSSGTGSTIVGLRYVPTNAEGIAASVPFEGWGVYDIHSGTAGWASAGNYPRSSGLELESATFSTTRATSVVHAAEGRLEVTHDFRPSPATANLYEIDVTIEHVGSSLVGTGNPVDVRYRRVVNWSVEPTPFNEYVTLQPTSAGVPAELEFTSNDGYAHPAGYDFKSDRGATGFFTNYGPRDQGALFDFDFGWLSRGDSVTFTLFYGAALTEQEALDAIQVVGANVYALGKPSGPGGPTQGTPNTFIFAYRSPLP